jgi:hypothetical protein
MTPDCSGRDQKQETEPRPSYLIIWAWQNMKQSKHLSGLLFRFIKEFLGADNAPKIKNIKVYFINY